MSSYFKTLDNYKVSKIGDRTGGVIESFEDKDIEQCGKACSDKHKCIGFSYKKGSCELKKSDGLTDRYYQNGKQFFENTQPKNDPTCDLNRGDTVYECGDYVYQTRDNAQAQCGNFGGSINTVQFIWDDASQSGCGINRGDSIFRCSEYAYQKESDAMNQCGNYGSTVSTKFFIPAE
jgi:hypothetical protein